MNYSDIVRGVSVGSVSLAVVDPPVALARAFVSSTLEATLCVPGKEQDREDGLSWQPDSWFSAQGLLRRLGLRGVSRHFLFCCPAIPFGLDYIQSGYLQVRGALDKTLHANILLFKEICRLLPCDEAHPLFLGFVLPRSSPKQGMLDEILYASFRTMAERCVQSPPPHCCCYGVMFSAGQEEGVVRVVGQVEEQVGQSLKRWFLLQGNNRQLQLQPGSKKLPVG